MSEQSKPSDVLLMHLEHHLPREKMEVLREEATAAVKPLGLRVIIVPPGARAEVNRDLSALIAEQQKTNQLLVLLIEALAAEEDLEDGEAPTYLDGTPRDPHGDT